MFTGLIQCIGELRSRRTIPGGVVLGIRHGFDEILPEGASVAVNGVCLTVISDRSGIFQAECYYETLEKTTLAGLPAGSKVNLEQALKLNGALDGHLVQGHVSGVVKVLGRVPRGKGIALSVALPERNRKGLIAEGSVALDGVSLTIADLEADRLTVQLIGETLERTTLKDRRPGDEINMESDFLLRGRGNIEIHEENKETITMGRLAQWGYV